MTFLLSKAGITWIVSILIIASIVGIYFLGRHDGAESARFQYEREKALSIARAIEQAEQVRKQDEETFRRAENDVQKIRLVYRDRIQEVIRHVPSHPDCVLPADGLHELNRILAGTP